MYRVMLTRPARRFFEHADPALQQRLDECFSRLAADPRGLPGIRPLKGKYAGHLRARIGRYRVVYRIEEHDRLVIVTTISHRREAYR
ncbi:MAG: type II toxin-antitoxin system RelE/ParE family toxin [Planctomycetota bacterium]